MRVETTIGVEDPAEPMGESLEVAIVGEAEFERGDTGAWGWSVSLESATLGGVAYRLSKQESWRALDALAEQAERDWNDSREAAVGL